MNNIKKREWFRPLAGIFLEENIDKYLENRIDYSWYMNTSCKIKPEYQKELEGISHIDKTTRPQVLNESICPNTYKILSGVENATGVGASSIPRITYKSLSQRHLKTQSRPFSDAEIHWTFYSLNI